MWSLERQQMFSGFSILHHSMKVSFLTAVISTRGVGQIQVEHFDIVLLTSPADPSRFPSNVVFKVHFNQSSLHAFIFKHHTSRPKAVFQTLHIKMSSSLESTIQIVLKVVCVSSCQTESKIP